MTLVDPHLDVDQVSGAVDGTVDPAVAAHLVGCLACRRQVDLWRRTLAPLRDVLPAADGARPDFVAVAMARWAPSDPEPRRADGPGAGDAGDCGSVADARVGAAAAEAPRPSVLPPVPAATRASGAGRRPGGGRPTGVRRAGAIRRLRPPSSLVTLIVLVALAGAAVVGLRHAGGPSGSVSTSAEKATAPQSTAGAAGSTAAGRTAPSGLPPTASSGMASAVPTVAGGFQLVGELRRVVATRPPGAVPTTAPCLRQARMTAASKVQGKRTGPSWASAVRVSGTRAEAYVFADEGGYLAVVLRTGVCSLLTDVRF